MFYLQSSSILIFLFFISIFPPPHSPYIDPTSTSLHLHIILLISIFSLLISIVFLPVSAPHFYYFLSSSFFSFLLFYEINEIPTQKSGVKHPPILLMFYFFSKSLFKGGFFWSAVAYICP